MCAVHGRYIRRFNTGFNLIKMNEIEKLDSNEQRLGWQRMKSLIGIMKK